MLPVFKLVHYGLDGQKTRQLKTVVLPNGSCSAWRLITRRVLQGFVLGHVLFNILTSHLEEVKLCTFVKSTGDTKL